MTPTLERAVDQINCLARVVAALQPLAQRVVALEAALAALNTPQFSEPSGRGLDAVFMIHASRPAIALYTVELSLVASVVGTVTNSANVDFTIDGRVIQSTKDSLIATIILGLSLTPGPRMLLAGIVPPGASVSLVSTLVGTGTATLISAQEVLI